VTLGPSDAYYMEDEAPPGPTYANPLTTTPPIYEEEALDAEELASGKLKKATMEDKLNRAVKKTRASIAEPVATIESDMDEDVCMQDMESDGAYTSLYDKDETVMEDWEEMPPPCAPEGPEEEGVYRGDGKEILENEGGGFRARTEGECAAPAIGRLRSRRIDGPTAKAWIRPRCKNRWRRR
jgi:hypothetical protein